jgi:hypothetical protein
MGFGSGFRLEALLGSLKIELPRIGNGEHDESAVKNCQRKSTKGAACAAPFVLFDAVLFVRTDQKSIPPIEVGLARLRSL